MARGTVPAGGGRAGRRRPAVGRPGDAGRPDVARLGAREPAAGHPRHGAQGRGRPGAPHDPVARGRAATAGVRAAGPRPARPGGDQATVLDAARGRAARRPGPAGARPHGRQRLPQPAARGRALADGDQPVRQGVARGPDLRRAQGLAPAVTGRSRAHPGAGSRRHRGEGADPRHGFPAGRRRGGRALAARVR